MIKYWMNEYREIFTNTGALLITIGSVVIYSFMYPIPYRFDTLREVPVALIDEDYSQMSRQLARMLDTNENIKITERSAGFDEAKQMFYAGTIFGIIVIPKGFERDIRRGQSAKIATYYDTSTLLYYRQLRTGVTMVARTLGAGIQMKKFQAAGYSREKAMASQDPLPYLGIPLFNPSAGYGSYVVPAVFILLVHQTLLVGIGMVIGTRRETIDLVGGKRLSVFEIPAMVLGRTSAYMSLGLFTALYSMWMLHHYYVYPLRGEARDMALFMVPFLASTTLFGFTIASFFRHREVAVLMLATSVPFLFMVGFAWPPEIMPSWLRLISCAIPNTAGVDGFLKLTQLGCRLREIPFDYYVLWIQVAVYFVLSCIAVWHTERVPETPAGAHEVTTKT